MHFVGRLEISAQAVGKEAARRSTPFCRNASQAFEIAIAAKRLRIAVLRSRHNGRDPLGARVLAATRCAVVGSRFIPRDRSHGLSQYAATLPALQNPVQQSEFFVHSPPAG
jgi:hypothetical protein